MQSIDLIRDSLRKSDDRVLAHVDDMRAHGLVFPTSKGGCHMLWVLGHLAYIEALVIRGLMLGEGTFGTYRLCLQYVADHWYMHRGHLADARRAAGVERMWV